MATVTSCCHSLLKFSGGAPIRSWKPAAVVPGPARKMKRSSSLCYALDPKSAEHQFNISPVALVHPTMSPTSTPQWKIQEDDKNRSVQLTFFNIPELAKEEDFQVAIEDDVLVIRTTNKQPPKQPATAAAMAGGEATTVAGVGVGDDVSFHVRLLMPKGYNKDGVRAELVLRALVVTVGKTSRPVVKDIAVERK